MKRHPGSGRSTQSSYDDGRCLSYRGSYAYGTHHEDTYVIPSAYCVRHELLTSTRLTTAMTAAPDTQQADATTQAPVPARSQATVPAYCWYVMFADSNALVGLLKNNNFFRFLLHRLYMHFYTWAIIVIMTSTTTFSETLRRREAA